MRGSLFTARARWLDRAALARRIRIAATLAVALQLVFATSAAAYTRSTATADAESWWSTYNTFWVRYDNDCANFVSQAIFAGGVPVNYSQTNPGMPSTVPDTRTASRGGLCPTTGASS